MSAQWRLANEVELVGHVEARSAIRRLASNILDSLRSVFRVGGPVSGTPDVQLSRLPEQAFQFVARATRNTANAFVSELAVESQLGSPVKTGRFRGSWMVSVGSPAFAGLAGATFPIAGRAQFDAALTGDWSKAYVTNDAKLPRAANAYAFVIDRGRQPRVKDGIMSGSLQAPLGVTPPAAERAVRQVEAMQAEIERRSA